MTLPTLTDLARWLGAKLGESEPLRRDGPTEVRRLALALEPADLPPTLEADALFLHRSRRVGDGWPGLGVLAAHDGFDDQLTTGPNHRLARALGWSDVREVIREGKRVGISATPPQGTWREVREALLAELGGEDDSWPPAPDPSLPLRLALMNAMNPGLIAQVAEDGVRLYLTGQMRPSAVGAARERGLGVIALGHRRTELWGLRRLARELEEAFLGLETRVYGGA
ncbi:Nif3-like dinuclear metal center hexameric protein [Deinococcus sp. SDU3-2]|uniref:Nif3-like dinuclear metal center hexameric protein n=1 Tax=Deinococcus terrestris TaxID=2651870 RepID=A0A7X1TSB7_9DEIO|nr:Nif3-like dinuclear metal center hexameric protein [Deinococcus terrestris]MPY67299.1 Nif3-like dinuclear metal center hexameric protein [Deinococcus terrestris]